MSRLETGILVLRPKRNSVDKLLQTIYLQMLPKAEEKGLELILERAEEKEFEPTLKQMNMEERELISESAREGLWSRERSRHRKTIGSTFTKKEMSERMLKGASLPRMARANLRRSRSKTAVTVISLFLSLVLLNITVTLSGGFDMDKYLRDIKTDFLVADASYFRFRWDYNMGISED